MLQNYFPPQYIQHSSHIKRQKEKRKKSYWQP